MPFYRNTCIKHNYKLVPVLLCLAISALISSCRHEAEPSEKTEFQHVLDSASAMYDAGDKKKAITLIDSVFQRYNSLTLIEKFGYYNLKYNYTYHILHDRDRAMLYADNMLNLFDDAKKKLKHPTEYGQAHFYKGDLLFDDNRYNEAYKYFYQGKIIANNSVDVCIISDYSYRIGMVLYKQGHYREAAANFKNSYAEHSTCAPTFKTFYRKQELLDNAGICYSKINEADSALYFFNKALVYIDEQKEKYKNVPNLLDMARGVIFGNQANVYIKQGKYLLAKQLLQKSAAINLRKGNDNADAQLSELKLAHIYLSTNTTDSLYALLQTVLKQSDTIKNQDVQADWNYLMAQYFIKKNDAKTALNYLTRYDTLKEVIAAKQKKLQEADVSEQIKRLEKNAEFDILQKNNQLQNVLLRVAIIFAILLFVIVFLVYRNWQRSRANISNLDNLNKQINDQNETLSLALEELDVSGQEKDRILRTVAHDLRNPMGGISSLTGIMAEEAESEELRDGIQLIKQTSDNSIELINEILEATSNKKVFLSKELVNINTVIANSAGLLRFKAIEKGQEITVDLLNDEAELYINREKIWRVISNLISNAIKFSPANGIISITANNMEGEVRISVKDNGIGVPDALKEKVFNMFTEAKRPGTAGEKSFGLGLSICRQIIEAHGGKIWVEDNPEGGAIFIFSLKKETV
ncbi:HAMP domain-containing sensor histidine kinase [Mucilaginibacter sp. L3T2-6]|uniref:tetratricopeptide repeat-containing sensor histidine kinase n=1 Tax=Mucilaginibacter sp. L3T2-6 TaxID=3062491 RepID=UPI002676CEF1|nr:HAMP domain-containing sensor histidine kinase [Mucilaginibacter sp. L3T2-6]MDO3643018.1 HAMP domain-containing sensor histidine kinase [Mucilaginibacter sp. L3T2-6]MDV6215785.1 HAMP domain-containing sensor histidine kinase [Mucilaginibacter sp. L3T2-6]